VSSAAAEEAAAAGAAAIEAAQAQVLAEDTGAEPDTDATWQAFQWAERFFTATAGPTAGIPLRK
jgi:hypothetical protein